MIADSDRKFTSKLVSKFGQILSLRYCPLDFCGYHIEFTIQITEKYCRAMSPYQAARRAKQPEKCFPWASPYLWLAEKKQQLLKEVNSDVWGHG